MINPIYLFLCFSFCCLGFAISSATLVERTAEVEWVYQYVAAEKGLRLRESPSLQAAILGKLPYGKVVHYRADEVPSELTRIEVGGEVISGHWVKLYEREGGMMGYVFDAYLANNMSSIPKASLYLYYEYQKNETRIAYPLSPLDYRVRSPLTGFWHTWYPYYEPNQTEPFLTQGDTDERVSMEYDDARLEALPNWIALELGTLADFEAQQVDNPYAIDTVFRAVNISPHPEVNDFLLPTTQGDSVRIHDLESEVYIVREYVGQIEKLNQYLIRDQFESPMTYMVDKETGAIRHCSENIPYISPDGKYQVDFYENFSYDYDIATSLTIKHRANPEEQLQVRFKAWLPTWGIKDVFWVSDTALVIKVLPVDFRTNNPHYHPQKAPHQYLKLKILF